MECGIEKHEQKAAYIFLYIFAVRVWGGGVSRRNKTQGGEPFNLLSHSPFFLLMSLIDNQTEAVIPQDATLPSPACLS